MLINEKDFIKNFIIQEVENSDILLAKKEFIVPEKKIILLDEFNEEEKTKLKKLVYRGGFIV